MQCVCVYNEILFIHKKNDILSFATMWMDLEGIILSEKTEKQILYLIYFITYIWNLKKMNITKQKQAVPVMAQQKQI